MGLSKSLKKLTRNITRTLDPFDIGGKLADKIGGPAFGTLIREGPLGNADNIKELAGSKFGSVLSGRAILQGGIREQNMETARTFDVFGSPATAGTKQQTTARVAAVIYGAAAAAGAAAAGSSSAASGTSVAGGGVAGGSGGAVTLAGTTVPVATGSAATWGGTLASIGKYAALGLTLGRQFGIIPPAGTANPGYGPETLPQENYLPNGLLGALGGEFGGYGPGMEAYADDESGMFSGLGSSVWYVVGGILLLLLLVFLFMRK